MEQIRNDPCVLMKNYSILLCFYIYFCCLDQCWENYVGKEFYKLGIFDFISVTLVIIFIKIPRR